MKTLWDRLLTYLRRNDFNYAPPIDPDVNHPYEELPGNARCCFWCGGGRLHAIHKAPYVEYRVKELERVRKTLQD